MIFGETLTLFALGEPIALYEHYHALSRARSGHRLHDQWGVELGKQLAKQINSGLPRRRCQGRAGRFDPRRSSSSTALTASSRCC
ncbi:MAG: hypothetical protein ACLU0O_02385 [Collinsella sp.]